MLTHKELKALIKLCRQMGVESIKMGDVELQLGPTPTIVKYVRPSKKAPKASNEAADTSPEQIDMPDMLTDEQLLNWSVDA